MSDFKRRFMAAKEKGERLAVLTAYDYPQARLLDECGIDILLVGDSLGMVVQGMPDTTNVTLEDIIYHTKMVARGVTNAVVVSDLPIHTYDDPAQAVEAAKLLIQAGAHAVKLEGGVNRFDAIAQIASVGIPIMGHVGMLPQSVKEEGGYRIKGKTPSEKNHLLADAQAVQEAGAFSVVLELVQSETASEITQELIIPTIGIGSGTVCDGEVLVIHDLIGLFPWFKPKFVKRRAMVADAIKQAVNEFIQETKKDHTS